MALTAEQKQALVTSGLKDENLMNSLSGKKIQAHEKPSEDYYTRMATEGLKAPEPVKAPTVSAPKEEGIIGKLDKYNPISQLTKGALKTVGQQAVSLGELGAKGMSKIFGGEGGAKGAEYLRGKIGQPEGVMQKAGAFGAETAELFTPLGEEAMAAKATEYLSKIPKVAKTIGAGIKSAAEGLKFGVEEGLKTGDIEEGKKAGKMGAGLSVTGKVIGGAWKGIKDLPGAEKIAEFLTNEKASTFQFAKENPELFNKYKQIAEDETIIPSVAKDLFDKVKSASKKVGAEWKTKEGEMLKTTEERLKTGAASMASNLRNKAQDVLKKEGINISGGKIDLSGSAFSKNVEAKNLFQNIYDIMREPSKNAEEVINKGKSISALLKADVNPNIKRVAIGLKNTLDEHLSELTGGAYGEMKTAYKKGIDPVNKIVDSMSTKNKSTGAREFSQDKAVNFVKQVVSDFKFDKKEILGKMQEVFKEKGISSQDFIKEMKGMSTAQKLSKTTPGTSGRMKDVVLSLGIAGHPLLGVLVSPKFWAGRMTEGAAEKTASAMKDLIAPMAIKKMLIDIFK